MTMNVNLPEGRVVNINKESPYIFKYKDKYVIASSHSKKRVFNRMNKLKQVNSNKFFALLKMFFIGAIEKLLQFENIYGENFNTDERYLLVFNIRHPYKENLKQGVVVKFKPDLYKEQSGIEGNQVILLSVFPPKQTPYHLDTPQGTLTEIEMEKQIMDYLYMLLEDEDIDFDVIESDEKNDIHMIELDESLDLTLCEDNIVGMKEDVFIMNELMKKNNCKY